MYMYNVIVYLWDLSNEQPVTIIEQRTRFFFQIVSVGWKKKINYDMYD